MAVPEHVDRAQGEKLEQSLAKRSGEKECERGSYGIDPVNSYNMLIAWSVDCFVTNDFIVNLAQRYYVNTTDEPVFETWGLGGVNRGRSETQLRLTYQF